MKRIKKNESASVVTRERVLQYLRTRYESIADLTPERIIRAEQDFDAGWLRAFSVLSHTLIETDDVLKGVVGKREKGPAVRGWEIATVDDSDEAKRDAERLKYFYDNLTVTNAVDENERGGVGLMIRQMQRAVGLKYACHEIVWEPTSKGVTATLRSVPLWFFENTLGRLRYLPSEGAVSGVDLEDGGWMVTVGDHLMRACARACLYKRLPMRDWLVYCARHGMPGIAGHTSAAKGSAAWNEMETALAAFAAEFAVVLSKDATIDKIDMSSSGPLPYPQLIERMDRAMASLWRGNDLSTMSRGGDASGASIQGEETEILVASDATMVSESSNWYLDRHVIYLTTGEDRKPLAYFTIKGLSRQNIDQDLKVDTQLHEMGVETSKHDLRERYGRRAPTDEADTVRAAAPAAPLEPLAPAPQVEAANEAAPEPGADVPAIGQFLATAKLQIAEAASADLLPLARALAELMQAADDADMSDADYRSALEKFYTVDMPKLSREVLKNEAAAQALSELFAASFVNGLADGAEATKQVPA